MRDDNVDNQDHRNNSEMMELGEIKKLKNGKMKYCNIYLLNNMNDNFQYKLRKKFCMIKKDDEYIAKHLLLKNALQ